MLRKKTTQNRYFDWILIGTVLLICLIGFLVIFSSNYSKSFKYSDLYRQIIILMPAFVAFFLATFFNYNSIKKFIIPLYVINLIALLAVLVLGHSAFGSQRWIHIAGLTFQPSEVAKLVLIITLAYLLTKRPIFRLFDLWPIVLAMLPIVLLILKQPDLGTSLVFVAIFLGMLLGANVSFLIILVLISPLLSMLFYAIGIYFWLAYNVILITIIAILYKKQNANNPLKWHFLKGIGVYAVNFIAGPASALVWHLLKDYQKMRIMIFLNPEIDPLGAGYHIIQSQIAIGSGGFWGKGLLHGSQTQLNFIPVQNSDFIFSVIGEEFGLIGGLVLLLLYTIILWRIMCVAEKANDPFGRFIAIGVGSMLLFHVFINIGMATGIMPVVGIPLPFVSYGGTSLLTNFLALGLLQSISLNRNNTA